jgi:hypothetical protein
MKLSEGWGGMNYVRRTYGVPIKRGRRIRFWGERSSSVELVVRSAPHAILASETPTSRRLVLHPTWRVEYLDGDGLRLWPLTDADMLEAELDEVELAPLSPYALKKNRHRV